jgi:hypothetical protein
MCAFLYFGTEPSRKNMEARWKLSKKERNAVNERGSMRGGEMYE